MRNDANWVVVDYLQLVKSGNKDHTRRDEVDSVIRHLIETAKRHNVTMILISNMAKSAGNAPTMQGSFKESSEIGFAVDAGFIGEPQEDEREPSGRVPIKWRCLGNRNGPPRSFTVMFDAPRQRYIEIDGGHNELH